MIVSHYVQEPIWTNLFKCLNHDQKLDNFLAPLYALLFPLTIIEDCKTRRAVLRSHPYSLHLLYGTLFASDYGMTYLQIGFKRLCSDSGFSGGSVYVHEKYSQIIFYCLSKDRKELLFATYLYHCSNGFNGFIQYGLAESLNAILEHPQVL